MKINNLPPDLSGIVFNQPSQPQILPVRRLVGRFAWLQQPAQGSTELNEFKLE